MKGMLVMILSLPNGAELIGEFFGRPGVHRLSIKDGRDNKDYKGFMISNFKKIPVGSDANAGADHLIILTACAIEHRICVVDVDVSFVARGES